MGKGKRPWSTDEVEALSAGVEKHGMHSWKRILSDPQFASSFTNRSNIDLKDKWRNLAIKRDRLNIKRKVEAARRDYLMHPYPLSSKKRSKKEVAEDLNDLEDNHNPCINIPKRSGTRNNMKNQTSEKRVKNQTSEKRVKNQTSEKRVIVIEEFSDSEDNHTLCTISRQRRRTRQNNRNQGRKLNSSEVHDYLESIWLSFPEDKKSSFTHINPLWYNFYSEDSNKEKVINWIRKKDIFSRKYVFFPIVTWGHWSVVIFCHFNENLESKSKTPCILLLDSLAKAGHCRQLEPIIRKFVLDIYKNLEMTEDMRLLRKMRFLVPKVPQQRDGEECGYFVLYYIKLFVENAPESFSTTNGYPYFMKKDWFNFEEFDSFCRTLDTTQIESVNSPLEGSVTIT